MSIGGISTVSASASLQQALAAQEQAVANIAGEGDPAGASSSGQDTVELTGATVAATAAAKVLSIQKEQMGQLIDMIG